MDRCIENVIEFLENQKVATCTFSQGRYKTLIKKSAVGHPEKCQIATESKDGTLVAHVPVEWIWINPCVELTEDERKRRAETMRRNIQKQRL